ncbi:unnamed protein product [Closterium sp. Yama58-4]|nr:unnamed protein product [Closterium sp. Yama58-4]
MKASCSTPKTLNAQEMRLQARYVISIDWQPCQVRPESILPPSNTTHSCQLQPTPPAVGGPIAGQVPAKADSLKGWTDLRLAAQVNYHHASSSHQVCFTAPVPGPYLLSLHLLFTNAFQLRSTRSPAFNHGYAEYEQVFARVIRVVAPPTYFPLALRALLPWCTADMLRVHGNQGYWLQHKWMPHACRLRTVTPVDALSCFHRHVLIMAIKTSSSWSHVRQCMSPSSGLPSIPPRGGVCAGDSEMRFFFGFLTHFLVNRTRGAYLSSMGGDLQAFHGLQSLPKTTNHTDGSGELLRTPVLFPPPVFTFYGGLHNGFTRQQFNVSMRGRTYLFNLTYASHMGAVHEVLPGWMYNTSLTGGEVVSRPDTPFRLAAYGSSLHDLITLDTAQDYARVARSHLLPSLRRLVQDPRQVTVFGPWAAREDSKPRWMLFKSDNVRGLAFEQEAASITPQLGPLAALVSITLHLGCSRLPNVCQPTNASLAVTVSGAVDQATRTTVTEGVLACCSRERTIHGPTGRPLSRGDV